MLGLVSTVLNLVTTVAPLFTSSTQVAAAIKTVSEAVPIAIAIGTDVWEQVKPAITALRQSEATTPAQLAELDAIEARGDAAFDAAYAKALAEDNA